ncbi:UNVERIFIED_CONTAM: hypothetical protein GTU68_021161 [Idotea baltica]|nr:hypothetical protein [Idotea baltica]
MRESSRYWTKPLIHPEYPNPNQNRYLNSVLNLECSLPPSEVLIGLQSIERQLGRVRENELHPWSPRTIDLDIIAAGDEVIDTAELTVPHPRAVERDFVLIPILEVCPDWVHPVIGKTVSLLISELSEVNILEKYQAEGPV